MVIAAFPLTLIELRYVEHLMVAARRISFSSSACVSHRIIASKIDLYFEPKERFYTYFLAKRVIPKK